MECKSNAITEQGRDVMRNSQARLSRKTRDAGGLRGSEFLKFPFINLLRLMTKMDSLENKCRSSSVEVIAEEQDPPGGHPKQGGQHR